MSTQSTHRARSTADRALARYDAIAHDLTVRHSPVLEQHLAHARDELLSATGCTSVAAARELVARQRAAAPPKKSQRQGPRSTGKPQPSTKKAAPRKQQHPLPYLRGQDEGRSRGTTKPRRALPVRMTGVVSGGLPSTSRRH